MLENVFPRDQLIGLARKRGRYYDVKSIHPAELEAAIADGWSMQKKNKRTLRVARSKSPHVLLEDRVWTLLYKMGFKWISGAGGAQLDFSQGAEESPKSQVDCVAIDDEVAIAVECKSFEAAKRDASFEEKLGKHELKRKPFALAVKEQFPVASRRQVGLALFTSNILLTDSDREKANDREIALFDDQDLLYYEKLVSHLGPASRYQFLANTFPMKRISGLEITVPALQTRVGKSTCYTFSIQPEYLLKIAFVSHRAKGKPSDVDAYQRMISKSRLRQIRDYISKDGVFPTNIVLNIEKSKYVRFDKGKQEGDSEGARMGWLTLTPAYGSAWVIDGQHRLYAYSGHPRATKSYLSVLAFESLPPEKQAKFFVDINHEQKSVKRNLLDELWAELHWDSDDDETRIRAVISKAVQALGNDRNSPFYGRILLSDGKKTDIRCISLSSLLDALNKPGFYLSRPRANVVEHGPLWAGSNLEMMQRTVKIVSGWFRFIATPAADWWNLGSGPGGGLAMNDGVTVCTNVLRSVLDFVQADCNLLTLADDEVRELLQPFGEILGSYFAELDTESRKQFRSLRGNEGQRTGTRMCQQAINSRNPKFEPPGLSEWIEDQKSGANEEAVRILDRMELTLQEEVLETLRKQFGSDERQWWFSGVPYGVRKKVDDRINESGGEFPDRDKNFDLIDYRSIMLENWPLFDQRFGHGEGNKDKRSAWIADCNKIRNIAKHPSKRQVVTREQIARLRKYDEWLHHVRDLSAEAHEGIVRHEEN